MVKKSYKLILVTVVILAVSVLVLAGCNQKDQHEASEEVQVEESEEEISQEAEIDEPVEEVQEVEEEIVDEENDVTDEGSLAKIEITDDFDNPIVLDSPAEKVIVFAPSVLEIIDALDAMDKVIGVDNWSVDSGEPLAQGFEGFGDYQGFNMEKIAEAQPDIIFALSGNPQEDIDRLKELGVEVYITEAISFEETYESMEKIGTILGLAEEADMLVSDFRSQVEAIFEKTKDIAEEDKPKVFYEIFNEPLWSAGSETFIDDMIDIAGGINIVAEDGISGHAEYSLEKLIENNPDIMIAGDGGMYEARTEDFILGDARFSSVDAVINENVYIVPENPVVRPNHNAIKGLEMFARAINPEIFGEFMVIE